MCTCATEMYDECAYCKLVEREARLEKAYGVLKAELTTCCYCDVLNKTCTACNGIAEAERILKGQ
jgi:hypothetical protein